MAHLKIEISNEELADLIMQELCTESYLGKDFDDAGSDLMTLENYSYMGDLEISSNSNTARLIDAYNILKYGKALHF